MGLNENIMLRCHTIANIYGFDAQSNQLIEECAELIQAINKYKRQFLRGQPVGIKPGVLEPRAMIVEEIADVEVMLCQMKYLLGIEEEEIEAVRERKIERTFERMGEQ